MTGIETGADASLTPERDLSRPGLWLLGALALTFLVYAPTLAYDLVYDDTIIVRDNPLIRDLGNIPRYFTADLWTVVPPFQRGQFYRPLWQTYATVSYALHGLDTRAWHLGLILIHLAITALIYPAAKRLTDDRAASILATLLFGLHPIHGEAVAWVAGANASLSALPVLICVLCGWYGLDGEGTARRLWLAGSLAAFTVGMFIKEDAVAGPGILAISAWCLPRKGARPTLLQLFQLLIPFGCVFLLYLPMRVLAIGHLSVAVNRLTFDTILCALPRGLCTLGAMLLAPVNLSVQYPAWPNDTTGLGDVPGPLLLLGLAGAAAGMAFRRDRRVGAAFAFGLSIVPLMNLKNLARGEILHDRFLYIPSIGFALLLALLISRGLRRSSRARRATLAATVALALVYAALTVHQTRAFATDITLFRNAHRVAPRSTHALENLICAHMSAGHPARSEELAKTLIKTDETFWRGHAFRGFLLAERGEFKPARDAIQRSLSLQPRDPVPLRWQLGRIELELGRPREALGHLHHVAKLSPQAPDLAFLIGRCHEALGDRREAAKWYLRQLRRTGRDPRVVERLRALKRSGSKP